MEIFKTPKVGTSDIEVKIFSILLHDEKAKKGDVVCELETSKSTFDVEAETDGFVYILHDEGDTIFVGDPLAIYSDVRLSPEDFKTEYDRIKSELSKNKSSSYKATKKAQALIDKYKIDISSLDKELITEKDVQNIIENDRILANSLNIKFASTDIVVIGIGGHASMCIDILLQNSNFKIVGFLDDNNFKDDKFGLKYLGKLDSIEHLSKCGLKYAILGIGFIGNLRGKEKMFNLVSKYVNIPSIIHPKAIVEPSANIKEGCQIMAGAIIGSNVVIDNNCIVNSGAIVSHDTIVSEGSHLTPGSIIAGHVKIGKRVTIGMGASVYIGLTISDDKVIMNGRAVFDNI